jgi:predicted dehydrogenase
MSDMLLVGAGPMAIEYAKVLRSLSVDTTVVGRGAGSAADFKEATGVEVHEGGIEAWLALNAVLPSHAIIAVGEKSIGSSALLLIKHGVKNLLVEKPGGATIDEIRQVREMAGQCGAQVFVGYNRRFYASVMKSRDIISEDGGVTSFNFEFTEWSHVVKDLKKETGVKEHWFLHNSTHVIDLAFNLGGKPRDIACYTGGGIDWHPAASIFSGAGVSDRNALFSYQANWEAPGRWGVEVLTKKHRLIFRPLEKLQIQKVGSVAIEFLEIDDPLDRDYKPGLFRQVQAFVRGAEGELCSIQEQADMMAVYYKMSNYPPVG